MAPPQSGRAATYHHLYIVAARGAARVDFSGARRRRNRRQPL